MIIASSRETDTTKSSFNALYETHEDEGGKVMKFFTRKSGKKLIPFLWLVILCLVFSITACSGPPGEVSLAYSWVSLPQYIYDENPATPDTIYNGEYFPSEPGTYYMEYIAWDGSGWWMEYTLTAEEGGMWGAAGDASYFEITLYSSGPSLWRWDSARSLEINGTDYETAPSASAVVPLAEAASGREALSEAAGREARRSGGYTLEIRYGKLR